MGLRGQGGGPQNAISLPGWNFNALREPALPTRVSCRLLHPAVQGKICSPFLHLFPSHIDYLHMAVRMELPFAALEIHILLDQSDDEAPGHLPSKRECRPPPPIRAADTPVSKGR
jgi:hypothetical protein